MNELQRPLLKWLDFILCCRIFLKDPFPTNPDLLYLVLFVHTQLTTTVTLAFLFGTKVSHRYVLIVAYYGTSSANGVSAPLMVGLKEKVIHVTVYL